jgi:hypothetical protein
LKERDSQRSKVYKWERKHFYKPTECVMNILSCLELIREISEYYEIPMPILKDDLRANHPYFKASNNTINIPFNMRKKWVIIHEISHAINKHINGSSMPSHGPEFVAIYMDVLNKFHDINHDELRKLAYNDKIKFASTIKRD